LCEARRLAGSEEYLASEKYEIRAWTGTHRATLSPRFPRLNHIRRANPALQDASWISFHNAFTIKILYYSKATGDLQNVVLVAINLDPRFPQECDIEVRCGLGALRRGRRGE